MRIWIPSEENQSSISIDIVVDPSSPSGESPLKCLQHLESWVYMVAFLVIVFSEREEENKNKNNFNNWEQLQNLIHHGMILCKVRQGGFQGKDNILSQYIFSTKSPRGWIESRRWEQYVPPWCFLMSPPMASIKDQNIGIPIHFGCWVHLIQS